MNGMPGRLAVVIVLALGLSGCATAAQSAAAARTPAEDIANIVREAMKNDSLRAVVVEVTKDGNVIASDAYGESLTGVPATTDMRFRNGAVAFSYIATLLLLFVDEGKVTLDDTIQKWMPDLTEADKVTLKMLANHTSGYPDFESDPAFAKAFYADPFRSWSFEDRLKIAFQRPMVFPPGTGWSYAHTNFMVLGEILSKIGGKPLNELLQEKVLGPMGLTATVANNTGAIPEPVLHAFSSERRPALEIPAGTPFYEEATFWNADWGTPTGASQSATIGDLTKTAIAVGTGKLLTPSSYHAMTDPNLLGFGEKMAVCEPGCFTQQDVYNYGLGVVRSGNWLLQNPLLGGYAATEAYLPAENVSIAVAVTFAPGAFDCNGGYSNSSDAIFRQIGTYMAPDNAPPARPAATKAC